MQAGIEMWFDASRHQNVRWDEEQRFMTGNLVLLARDREAMSDFVIGVVHESKSQLLREGRVVLKLVRGVNKDGEFKLLDQVRIFLNGRNYAFVGECEAWWCLKQ